MGLDVQNSEPLLARCSNRLVHCLFLRRQARAAQELSLEMVGSNVKARYSRRLVRAYP